MTAECPYTLQWATPSPIRIAPLYGRDVDPHLTHGSLGSPKSSSQMASQSVQPFMHGSLVWQTDRPRYSVRNNRPHLRTQHYDAA